MPVVPSAWLTAAAVSEEAVSRNGLASFDSRLFVDDGLRSTLTTALLDGDGNVGTALLDAADHVRYTGPDPRPLVGLHALLEVDEVTLVSVPDAVQRAWTIQARPPSAMRQAPDMRPVGLGAFAPCAAQQLTAPVLGPPQAVSDPTSPPQPDPDGAFVLTWTPTDVPDAIYVLEQSVSSTFTPATTFYAGTSTTVTVHDLAGGLQPASGQWFRVRAVDGPSRSGWSNSLYVAAGPVLRPVVDPIADYSDSPLIEVQRALLRAVAARGDMFAALALPAHYNEAETRGHLARLFASATAPPAGVPPVPVLDPGEARTLSFGALYHPWPVLTEPTGAPVSVPPDATAVAIMADRALSQGAWMAPANVPLANAVSLAPALDRGVLAPGAVPQINVLSQEPIGFVCLSEWTLSVDPDLAEISVRRLLSLLRRVALLWGPRYVFEPNDAYLVHSVTRDFEGLLLTLFVGGAFAGDTPAHSFFVDVRSGGDPSTGLPSGEVVIDIGVAPSLPLRFLTVQLSQQYGGSGTLRGS
jgi:hypothetical protein